MKDVRVYAAKHGDRLPKKDRFFFNGHEVSEHQAREIVSVGGEIATDPNEWFWRYWA